MWWLLIPAAYIFGSLSFAYWAGRLNGKDLRQHGSGNLGATNAGRVLGWRWFALVFILDLAKGALPVLAAAWHLDQTMQQQGSIATLQFLPIATAAAAVLGHVFTCFHGFKGGKAVATSLGVLVGLAPLAAALILACWLLAWCAVWAGLRLGKSDAVGPASILAALAAVPAYVLTANPVLPPTLWFLALLSLLILIKHRTNFGKFIAQIRAKPPASSIQPPAKQ
jgi:glycerol-3-phosphate acyltransferase PlsY